MEVFGYLASALIGLSLGLIGGGGSILTVPVLVYLFGIPPLQATSYSLFIVGATSLIGSVNNVRNGSVNLKAAFSFGLASVITVFFTRRLLLPAISSKIFQIAGFVVTIPFLTMILFGMLMLAASVGMIGDKTLAEKECSDCVKFFKLLGYGIGIGLITGLLGAGGGFLLIPALMFLIKLPMKKAVGTSLVIIAMNSLFGFVGDLGHFTIRWIFLLSLTMIAVAGIAVGTRLSKGIPAGKLKKGFGWFVLLMGSYIILKEISEFIVV